MIKRRYMRTRQLKPGMIIDQVIKDPTGRNLVVQGSAIDDYIISSLLKLGIMSVYIREGSADPDDPDAILSPKAAAMVKQLRTDDRSKVTLSDSVRQLHLLGKNHRNSSHIHTVLEGVLIACFERTDIDSYGIVFVDSLHKRVGNLVCSLCKLL